MLRISQIKSNNSKVIFLLEGKIIGSWVNELLKECSTALTAQNEITLDLAMVSYIDESGVYALKALEEKKVKITNCSLFLSALLLGTLDSLLDSLKSNI